MRHVNHIYRTYLLPMALTLSLILAGEKGVAQETLDLATLDQLRTQQLYARHGNAAGMTLDRVIKYTVVGLSGSTTGGGLHRAMEGKSLRSLSATAEGAIRLGEYHFWGSFLYDRELQKEVGFNASLTRPYRGMPYMVVDRNVSDWQRQLYQMDFRVGSTLYWDRLSLGLSAGYAAEQGAKQRDIRSHNNTMRLYLQPSLLCRITERSQLSLLLKYASRKEESRMQNVNVYVDQPYYELYGLGAGTARIGSGRTTNYEGQTIGAGLQYGLEWGVRTLLHADIERSVEDAEISFTNPQRTGTILADVAEAGVEIQSLGDSPSEHHFSLHYRQCKRSGIQYLTKYDSSESFKGYEELHRSIRYQTTSRRLEAGYSWSWSEDHPYEWLIGIKGALEDFGERYLLPASEVGLLHSSYEAELRKVLLFDHSTEPSLDLSLRGGLTKVHRSSLTLDRTFTDPFVTKSILEPDHKLLSTDRWRAEASATYTLSPMSSSSMRLYLRGDLSYSRAVTDLPSHRMMIKGTIGCLF